jgi:hypothetical protein
VLSEVVLATPLPEEHEPTAAAMLEHERLLEATAMRHGIVVKQEFLEPSHSEGDFVHAAIVG